MTYSPGGPGYPSPSPQSQPPSSYGAPGQYSPPQQQPQGPAPTPTEPGPSQLPLFVSIAVVVLGIAVYLANFAPQYSADDTIWSGGLGFQVIGALLAGLLAGVSLLPKQKSFLAVAAVISVISFLLAISDLIQLGGAAWGQYLVVVLILLQAIAAVVAVLFDAEIITPPVPRPKYEQQPYGYGGPGGYYGQQGPGPQQRQGGYPPQQPYGGYPQGPNTGGFQAPAPQQSQPGQHSQQSGPPTPPTGFPTYGQPPSGSQSANNQPTTQVPTSQAQPPAAPPQSSGPAPS